jgi:hypothetical protein
MSDEIYYVKKGRKYVPISQYDNNLRDSLPYGSHLIVVKPGSKSVLCNIDPALAPMIAAGRYARDAISSELVKASEARPQKQLTKRGVELWEELKKESDMFYVYFPSAYDITEQGLKAMQIEADKMLQNEKVKRAYDHFMTIWKLTKDEQ